MFEPRKNLRYDNHIAQIQEMYRDHPCMLRVNALKEQLKQEKQEDKAFYQSVKSARTVG